jgi:2-dehydro-3-deoxygluconokinase
MSQARSRIVCVGEAAIEFARCSDGRFAMGCGGDTFHAAIYLARAGHEVAFASALGTDVFSDAVLALAATENVANDLVLRVAGRLPGVCVVDKDAAGVRRMHEWNDAAPVHDLFELDHWDRIAEGLLGARMVYFSGITLSTFSNVGIGRFLAILEVARQHGVKVAFDCNFRPRGWKGDVARARTVFMEALKRVDMALPAFDDEAVLWGDPSPESTVDRMQAFGIGEIVVKNGPNSALVAVGERREHIPVPEVVEPVDMQAAGDAFNAGYLGGRLKGEPATDAAAAGHRLAAQVIRHQGAILPRTDSAVH